MAAHVPGDHMPPGMGRPPSSRVHVVDEPVALECGATLPRVVLAYNTYGTLNERRDNSVVVGHRCAARDAWRATRGLHTTAAACAS